MTKVLLPCVCGNHLIDLASVTVSDGCAEAECPVCDLVPVFFDVGNPRMFRVLVEAKAEAR